MQLALKLTDLFKTSLANEWEIIVVYTIVQKKEGRHE